MKTLTLLLFMVLTMSAFTQRYDFSTVSLEGKERETKTSILWGVGDKIILNLDGKSYEFFILKEEVVYTEAGDKTLLATVYDLDGVSILVQHFYEVSFMRIMYPDFTINFYNYKKKKDDSKTI